MPHLDAVGPDLGVNSTKKDERNPHTLGLMCGSSLYFALYRGDKFPHAHLILHAVTFQAVSDLAKFRANSARTVTNGNSAKTVCTYNALYNPFADQSQLIGLPTFCLRKMTDMTAKLLNKRHTST